jgi:hypothetical protein
MLKARLLLIIGIWVAILPYLGFPYGLKSILFSITGLFIVYISFVVYKETRFKKTHPARKYDNFSESMPPKIKEIRKVRPEVNEQFAQEPEQF